MTVSQTIIAAQEHAKHGRIETACQLIRDRMEIAKRGNDQIRLDIARLAVLDAAIDAMVSRSQPAA